MNDTSRPLPVVLDTDIGGDVDDVLALAFCALHPGIELRCVTTVNGDTHSRARLARALLDLLGRPEVPVAAGASLGLSGDASPGMPASLRHGRALVESTALSTEPASAVLVDALEGADRPVEVCVIGAATNVAATLAARPELVSRVAAVNLMGGHLGSVPAEPAESYEYNVSCDPLAVAVLWALPVPLRLVPLDVTRTLVLTPDDRAAIAGAAPHGGVFDSLMKEHLAAEAASSRHAGEPAVRLHDPLTVVGLIVPEVETLEHRMVSVFGPPGRVRTVETDHGRSMSACRGADGPLLRKVLLRTLSTTPGTEP